MSRWLPAAAVLPKIHASASTDMLAGSRTSATLNFEPGSWDNLFHWMYYYVPPGFDNSYPRTPDDVPVTANAIDYGMSDGISEWHLDISPSGLITITGRLIEMDYNLYTAVVKVSSAAFVEPRSGGVVKVSDNFTYPVTAEMADGTLLLRAPGAHISELGTYVATFQLTVRVNGDNLSVMLLVELLQHAIAHCITCRAALRSLTIVDLSWQMKVPQWWD